MRRRRWREPKPKGSRQQPPRGSSGKSGDPRWLDGLQRTAGNDAVRAVFASDGSVPDDVRSQVESSLGQPLSDVEIHRGPDADRAAENIDAAAFTAGSHVFLHSSVPSTDTPVGQAVLKEELAHVAQGAGSETVERVADPGEPSEVEARAAASDDPASAGIAIGRRPDAANAIARVGVRDLKKWLLSPDEEGEHEQTAPDPAKTAAAVEEDLRASEALRVDKEALAKPLSEEQKARMLGLASHLEKVEHNAEKVDPGVSASAIKSVYEQVVATQTPDEVLNDLMIETANDVLAAEQAFLVATNTRAVTSNLVMRLGGLADRLETMIVGATPTKDGSSKDGEGLTPSGAAPLKAVVSVLGWVRRELKNVDPPYDLVISQLQNIKQTLLGTDAPPTLQPHLYLLGLQAGIAADTLTQIKARRDAALVAAKTVLANVIAQLKRLSAVSAEPPPSAADDITGSG